MAETYTTAVERLTARYKARGIPADRALNMAEKRASAMSKRAHPGEKLSKRHNFKRNTDPVPPKEKKKRTMRQEDIKKFAEKMVMEIASVGMIIGQGGAGPGGGPVGVGGDPGGADPSPTGRPLSQKYRNDTEDDPTKKKTAGGAGGGKGFKASGGLKKSIPKSPEGMVTKGVDKMESIEKEFGIK